jgi:putative ABC transport system substrate-binding protein
VKIGGLAFYGPDRTDLFRSSGGYVDRILRDEKPGDLPFQQPTKYELMINSTAAKALGRARTGLGTPRRQALPARR